MTEAVLTRPRVLRIAALSPEDLALLHADLPLDGLELVEFSHIDAETLRLSEWEDGVPLFPSGRTAVAERP